MQILSHSKAFCSGYCEPESLLRIFQMEKKKKFYFAKPHCDSQLNNVAKSAFCTRRTAKQLSIPSATPPRLRSLFLNHHQSGFVVRPTGLTTSWFRGWLDVEEGETTIGKQDMSCSQKRMNACALQGARGKVSDLKVIKCEQEVSILFHWRHWLDSLIANLNLAGHLEAFRSFNIDHVKPVKKNTERARDEANI